MEFSLLKLLLLLVIINTIQGQNALGDVTITSTPSQVSEASVLELIVSMNSQPIPADGKIKITIPDSTSITSGDLACTMIEPVNTDVTCTATGNEIEASLVAGLTVFLFQLNIPGFTNPATTAQTDSFQVFITDSSDTVLYFKTTGSSLTATVGDLTAASITSSSDVVGEIATSTFSITLKHEMTNNGTIQVTFPKWNPNAAADNIFSMIQGTYI